MLTNIEKNEIKQFKADWPSELWDTIKSIWQIFLTELISESEKYFLIKDELIVSHLKILMMADQMLVVSNNLWIFSVSSKVINIPWLFIFVLKPI